jgi:flagellar basal body P-ring formation protein FlgA
MHASLVIVLAFAMSTPSAQTQTVSVSDLQREVETAMVARLRDLRSPARVVAIEGLRDQTLPVGRVRLDVGMIAGRWPRSRAGVPIRVMVDGRAVRILTAWVALSDVRSVPTYAEAASTKSAAETLRLVPGDVDMTCCGDAQVVDVEALSGMRVRRAVRAGEPALRSDFEPMPDVAERQKVGIEVVRGSVRLTTTGVALGDARIGQTVSVRPDASSEAVRARVIAKQQVILE